MRWRGGRSKEMVKSMRKWSGDLAYDIVSRLVEVLVKAFPGGAAVDFAVLFLTVTIPPAIPAHVADLVDFEVVRLAS